VCLSVFLSVCHPSYGRNSHSIFIKLYTIDRNPKSKNPFVGGQNPTIPSPIFSHVLTPVMYCQWQGLSTKVSNHVDRLWRFIAQRTLLGGRYTDRGVAQTSHVGGGGHQRFIAQRTLLGGRYTDRGVAQTSHVGGGGHQLPFPLPPLPFSSSLPFFPPFPQPSTHPFPLSPPLLSLPSPHPSHSPLRLEVGLLIVTKGSGCALAPPPGSG